jgi:hypothetical protein
MFLLMVDNNIADFLGNTLNLYPNLGFSCYCILKPSIASHICLLQIKIQIAIFFLAVHALNSRPCKKIHVSSIDHQIHGWPGVEMSHTHGPHSLINCYTLWLGQFKGTMHLKVTVSKLKCLSMAGP